MLRYLAASFLILALTFPSRSFAQSPRYSDADSPSEAVGMMEANVVLADALLHNCAVRLPQDAAEMAAQLKKWKTVEAHDIERAHFYWRQMVEERPSLEDQLSREKADLNRRMALPGKMNHDNKARVLSLFCKRYFADLGSGIWRQRTPRVYKFLDAAP